MVVSPWVPTLRPRTVDLDKMAPEISFTVTVLSLSPPAFCSCPSFVQPHVFSQYLRQLWQFGGFWCFSQTQVRCSSFYSWDTWILPQVSSRAAAGRVKVTTLSEVSALSMLYACQARTGVPQRLHFWRTTMNNATLLKNLHVPFWAW